MAESNWRLEGEWMKNCNCAFGCPCDFKGHFNETRLDGLSFFVTVHFPGALHEGNGEAQPIIDERATPEQREALFNIMSGQNSAEGTLFHIFSLIVTKMHDPIFGPIQFQFDKAGRTARAVIPGVLETEVARSTACRW
jgi:hypothetical protein